MKTIERRAFANFDEFRQHVQEFRLVFFHVFDATPDQRVLDEFGTYSAHELVVLLDVREDKGFLGQNLIGIDITRDKRTVSKPLIEMRGLGAWAKGRVICATEDPTLFDDVVRTARQYILPSLFSPTPVVATRPLGK